MVIWILLLLLLSNNINNSQSIDEITDVRMVLMNHFDCGYNDPVRGYKGYAVNVINEYFDTYFPLAVEVGTNITFSYNKTYTWTTQSWLISLYFECPTNMGLHCPSTQQQQYTLWGINQKFIVWHSFPFNSQLATYDTSLIEFGLKLSTDCANKYNLSYIPKVLSQRDVPGMTKNIIPILTKNNINAISIGSNDGSTPPNVPRIFKWYHAQTNQSIITMLHPFGYGGVNTTDAVLINNFSTAFVTAFKGDNRGPPNVEETLSFYKTLQTEFPNANIVASSFDDYINLLLEDENKHIIDCLPIVDQEMGDTWSWGISSDPWKNTAFRIAMRKRAECLQNNLCSYDSDSFYNFSRLLLKNGEHTWGGGVTHFLTLPDNYYAWSNKEFEKRLHSNSTDINGTNEMQKFKESWYEQRNFGLIWALQALQTSKDLNDVNLYKSITNEWNMMYAVKSPLNNNWKIVDSSAIYRILSASRHVFEIQFDVKTGALSRLYDMNTSVNYASSSNLLGEFIYQSLNEMDYMEYMNEYVPDNKHPKPWKDESKIGIEEFGAAEHQYITATLINLYQNKYNETEFITELSFDGYTAHLHEYYGGPTKIYNHISFNNINNVENNLAFNMQLTWINKTATRLPESIWFKFNPLMCNDWSVDKLDKQIYLSNVMEHGALHFMATTGNVACSIKNNVKFKIMSYDVPGIGFVSSGKNELFALPTPFVNVSQDKGCGYCLYNNLWGTNYIMWYPYDLNEKNATFRFQFYL